MKRDKKNNNEMNQLSLQSAQPCTIIQIDEIENNKHKIQISPDTSVIPWVIPRPSLVKFEIDPEIMQSLFKNNQNKPRENSSTFHNALPTSSSDLHNSFSSTSSTNSNTSSNSANSQTLLLTAANLAILRSADAMNSHHEYQRNSKGFDNESLASSTHFTLINGMERKIPAHKKPIECCCERHQLRILITSMTLVLAATVLFCIYFVHLRRHDSNLM